MPAPSKSPRFIQGLIQADRYHFWLTISDRLTTVKSNNRFALDSEIYQVLLLLMGIFWFSSQCYQDRSLHLFNVERKFPLKVATPGRCWFSFWPTRFPWEKSKWKNKKFPMTWSISYGSKNTSANALVWILVRKDFMPFLFKGRVDTEPWIS